MEHLRGQIALEQRRGSDAARLLLSAARRLEPLDPGLARETHLEALWEAAMLDGPGDVGEAAEAARAAPSGARPPRAVDVLLDAFALRLIEGHAAAAPALSRAVETVLTLDVGADDVGRWLWLAGWKGRPDHRPRAMGSLESWRALASRQARFARGAGALVRPQCALNCVARSPHSRRGAGHGGAVDRRRSAWIAEATGKPPVAHETR